MKRTLLPFFFLLIFLCPPAEARPEDGYDYKVIRVVDGDTLVVKGPKKKFTIRLIGVDTPEFHESEKLYRDSRRTGQDIKIIRDLGKRAGNFVKKLVKGRQVRLEYGEEDRDRYGRTLAYVFFPMREDRFADKTGEPFPRGRIPLEREYFLNEALVKYGYAVAYTRFPFAYRERFLRLQGQAREEGLGLWAPDKKKRRLIHPDEK